MEVKPLFCILSPRDIPKVIMSLQDCPFDKYWIRFYRSPQAYKIMKDIFTVSKEYTHLVIWTDDVVYNHENMMRLLRVAERSSCPIITGVGNVDRDGLKEYLTITRNLPHFPKPSFDWYHRKDIIGMAYVMHSGMIPAVIARGLAYTLSFVGDMYGHNQDVVISNDLYQRKIPLLADTDAQFEHMRHAAEIKVGHVPAYTEWERCAS